MRRRRKSQGPQMGEDEQSSKAIEISPEQAFSDIDKEFVDRSTQGIH